MRIEGRDDAGAVAGGAVGVTVPGRGARTLTAQELESGEGEGLTGALGTGTGRWRLVVSADQPIEVMSLVASAGGHLANVSTVPGPVDSGSSEATPVHRVAWLPAAVRWTQGGYQGVVRIVNRSDSAGEVRIEAVDDAGVQAPAVTLAIAAHEALELTSAELESGSAHKGLSGGIGTGEGDWWLRLTTGLDIKVLAYVQAQDGFVSPVHDAVPRVGSVHRVGVFNPASETSQASRLRLVNPGAQPTEVRIEGIDDTGVSSDGAVTLTLGGGAARTLGAAALESGDGEGLSGGLGDGTGRWRLLVSADTALEVMSPLASPSGQVANLSTTPNATAPETAEEVFAQHISAPVVQEKCVLCHTAGGIAGATRLHFVPASNPEHQALNLETFEDFIEDIDDDAEYILNKIQGVGHGGGVQVAAGTPEFTAMERFLALLGEGEVTAPAVTLTPRTLFDTVTMAPARKTLRRAALIFAGRNPTEAEYAAAERGTAALRRTIRGLMTGPEFHEFLIRGANDRLLTDRQLGIGLIGVNFFVDYVNETYRLRQAAHKGGGARDWRTVDDWHNHVNYGVARAPLELIAHVTENDLPYTEILTADYIMANPSAARAYGASTRFDDPEDVHEFRPSRIASYFRLGDGFESEYDPVVDAKRIIDPGPLSTNYPHAGILNTTAFLSRYPTTATNRNRARSRWTWYHFLGLDIEKSASRTTDPLALADTNNPTLFNPACAACHRALDPIAGTFQNYGDVGYYKDQWGGFDSLDPFYKDSDGSTLTVRAESWRDREALSWSVTLAAGVETLRVRFRNDFADSSSGAYGVVYLDRIRVLDADSNVLGSHKFEALGPPVAPWGPCGEIRRNAATGRNEHLAIWKSEPVCAIYIDVDVPATGRYDVEVVAWSNGPHERYGESGFAQISVVADAYAYREGDTWYRDMRAAGFTSEVAPNSDNSVQWLAERIVADNRFADATVKFWWPAIMGSEVSEPPEEEGDAGFEGLLLAANAQAMEVRRLAAGFKNGFAGRAPYNLKDLLVEIVLSKWFRADAVDGANSVRDVALRDAGARRLLTPEELARKTAALTGIEWGRHIRTDCDGMRSDCKRLPSALTGDYLLLYGGIDSDGISDRAQDMTSVMASVARTHALEVSCPVVLREFYLLPDAERLLFSGIDRDVTPVSESGANAIRGKLVELHEKLLGVRVTPHSPDVEAAYRLFVDVWSRKRSSQMRIETRLTDWRCPFNDISYFEGILDDAIAEHRYLDGVRYYDFDWDRVNAFMEGIDRTDPQSATQTWVVVLASLLMDYRYLYL